MTAYPIPTHLKPFLTPLGEKNSELSVTGVIRCKCGHLLFTPYANEAGTVAAAKCRSCGSKILLFHAGRHGWDGFVAKAGYLYDLSGRLTAMDTCPHCRQKTAFGLRVSITSAGRQDFIDESELTDEDGNALSEEDWVNAFDSFRLAVICAACGKLTTMLEKARSLLSSFHLKEAERILVGYSGGADSTALLVFLAEACGRENIAAYHVHHGIRGNSAESHLLVERDAEFVEGLAQLRIYFVEVLGTLFLLGGCIVADSLEVDFGNVEVSPAGHLHSEPVAVGFKSEVEQPLRLALHLRDVAHHILIETLGNHMGVDVGYESIFIVAGCGTFDNILVGIACVIAVGLGRPGGVAVFGIHRCLVGVHLVLVVIFVHLLGISVILFLLCFAMKEPAPISRLGSFSAPSVKGAISITTSKGLLFMACGVVKVSLCGLMRYHRLSKMLR